jgi:hypothetical protein
MALVLRSARRVGARALASVIIARPLGWSRPECERDCQLAIDVEVLEVGWWVF